MELSTNMKLHLLYKEREIAERNKTYDHLLINQDQWAPYIFSKKIPKVKRYNTLLIVS